MKPSSFQTAIRLQFDCLVKRVIDTTVKDYQRELSRRATHEIAFSELPEQELNHVLQTITTAIILVSRYWEQR